MANTTWTYIAGAAAVAAACGGGYYYYTQHTVSREVIKEPAQIVAPQPAAPSNQPDDETRRKTLEGIGSIKNLKPVPIPNK
jgi:hypothetical protein